MLLCLPIGGLPNCCATKKLKEHMQSCLYKPDCRYQAASTLSPSSTASAILMAPPGHLKGEVGTQLLSHLVQGLSHDGVLEVRAHASRGWAQTWVRTTSGSKSSEKVTPRTLQCRAGSISEFSTQVCGSAESARAQHAASLRVMSRDKQRSLLVDAGIAPKGAEPSVGLSLKADMHMCSYSIRKLCLWLKEFGVSIESERCMREQFKEGFPFSFMAKEVPMSSKQGSIVLAPLVAIYP